MKPLHETTFFSLEKTEDPYVVIESKTEDSVTYRSITNNERWVIYGKCNCCGECEVGSNNPNIVWTGPVGEPNAEYDIMFNKRKDIPVRPDISRKCTHCTLKGEYL